MYIYVYLKCAAGKYVTMDIYLFFSHIYADLGKCVLYCVVAKIITDDQLVCVFFKS